MSYLASIGIFAGIIIAIELAVLYFSGDVIVNGEIMRDKLYTGWGIYNNLGVIAVMSIPFAFYYVTRARFATPWIVLSFALLATAILTCSRGAIVFGIPLFIVCLIIALVRGNNRAEIALVYVLCLIGTVAACAIFWDKISTLFGNVPSIIDGIGSKTPIENETRLNLYKKGLDVFKNNPIFGETFYPVAYEVYDFSEIESFSSFFPPRWHNTVVQILASCGIVGMIAYLFHRISTIVLFIKKKNRATTFIGLSILALLLMSLVDCHFFNVGPVLFYSTMLAVMECSDDEPF
jgi:O-antigen ligase